MHSEPNETLPQEDFEAFYSEILEEFGPQTRPQQPQKKISGHTGKTQAEIAVQNTLKRAEKGRPGRKPLLILLALMLAGLVGIILWLVVQNL